MVWEMTKQQIEYLSLYEAGYTVPQIARMKNKHKSTVYRSIKRAKGKKCPFSADCERCPLPECCIDWKYAVLLNGREERNI